MVIYYTGTGNSRIIAEKLAERLGDELVNSFEAIKNEKFESYSSEKPWVFVCPTYSFQIPRIFENFIRKSTFTGSKDAYFFMTCGSGIWNAEKHLRRLCPEVGLNFKGLKKVLMPENYTAMFPVPGQEKLIKIIAAAIPDALSAADAIEKGMQLPQTRYGVLGHLDNGQFNKAFYKVVISAKGFRVKASCTGCGQCERLCPTNNIKMESGRPSWSTKCTHCMACINACPVKAIEYKKVSAGKPRIYNGEAR